MLGHSSFYCIHLLTKGKAQGCLKVNLVIRINSSDHTPETHLITHGYVPDNDISGIACSNLAKLKDCCTKPQKQFALVAVDQTQWVLEM